MDAVSNGFSTSFVVGSFVLAIFFIWCMWRVFEKAGKPGWACLIPIYNALVMLDIAKMSRWWIFGYLVPILNIIVAFMVSIGIAERFGKGTLFGFGLALLGFIFYPILALGDATYRA